MTAFCSRVSQSRAFHDVVILAILANAVLVGLETSQHLMSSYGRLLTGMAWVLQGLFVVEIAVRIVAFWPRPAQFFRDGWNVFDFVLVVVAMLPVEGEFATVARLFRLLRVTRLISAFPQLRLIVRTMLLSIPSMGHVILLMGLLLYIYGVAGVHLFGRTDELHWGTLSAALLSLFQIVTLEGWADMQKNVLPGHPWAWVYFSSFIVLAVFVVVNLFIAVVINNLETAKEQEGASGGGEASPGQVEEQVKQVRKELEKLESLLKQTPSQPDKGS